MRPLDTRLFHTSGIFASGGHLFQNNNDVIQTDQTKYICNGENGQNSENGQNGTNGTNATIQTTFFEGTQGSCTNGGIKVDVLIDGVVQDGQTQYICNATNSQDGCAMLASYGMIPFQCIDKVDIVKGNIVTFGKYPQWGDTPEPIRWIVLDVRAPASTDEKGRLLLLSEYVIDGRHYQPKTGSGQAPLYPTWANSDIRAWLNDTSTGFLSAAFSATELDAIIEVTNSTSDAGSVDGGENTNDMVFLLDISDARKTAYFINDAARRAFATSYAIQKGVYADTTGTGDKCHTIWWLRSPYRSMYCSVVSAKGVINGSGADTVTYDTTQGVHPALWIEY